MCKGCSPENLSGFINMADVKDGNNLVMKKFYCDGIPIVLLQAIKDIKEGEELLYDYGGILGARLRAKSRELQNSNRG
jgi:SET domain-containing protein